MSPPPQPPAPSVTAPHAVEHVEGEKCAGPHETRDDSTTPPAAAAGPASGPSVLLPPPPEERAPDFIEFYKDVDDDGYGFRSLLEAITNPQLLTRIHGALRTVGLVTFPLYTIALHPNTQPKLDFPPILIAAVVSTSTHRNTLGEQIGLHSWIWHGLVFMMIWGTAADAWGVSNHNGAWYGLLAAGIFGAGLLNNGMLRRFMLLYFFLYMLELRTHQHYFGSVPGNDAAFSAADYMIGTLMGVAANCVPFPMLMRDTVDMILTKTFAGFGKLLMGMITYLWTTDVHSGVLFFNDRTPFVSIEAVLGHMSSLLWFTNWEPMEFPLRNPIRRYKLSLLRRLLALAYAAFSCGRTVAELRKRQADRVAMHRIRCELYRQVHGRDLKVIETFKIGGHGDTEAPGTYGRAPLPSPLSDKSRSGGDVPADVRDVKQSVAALRENSRGYVKDFGVALMQTLAVLGATESTPEKLLQHVPFETLREKDTLMRRNLRVETLEVMKLQSDMVARRRQRHQQQQEQEQELNGDHDADDDEDADGDSVAVDACAKDEAEDTAHAPFGRPRRYRLGRRVARTLLEHSDAIDDAEVFIRINEMFFHLLLGMIAGEVLSFGEQMKDYKPAKSLARRFFDYYFVDPWNDFWKELWCRITFARPTDYRTVKDAFRMTCAYLAAVALNIEVWVPDNGLYFFGVTPLLGLPVEEESLGLAINRITGNTMGCALGYLSYHNTQNLAQKIAMTLCFTFLLQCCKHHPVYGQAFFYGSIINLAGLATSMIFNELLTRLVTSTYTIIAYMLCCLFIFPNDCIKICWNNRCKLTRVVSETIDDVALTLHLPLTYDAGDGDDISEPVAYPARNTEAMQMCSQLNIELSMAERLLSMCNKWAPFAAGDLIVRGMAQFPTAASGTITLAHQRIVANLRLLVFGVQLLHRPRAESPSPNLRRMIDTSLGDFLDDFADVMRLVGMDHVQSMQQSRTWLYPRHLSRISQLSRLRVRLHALMFECYVLVANRVSRGTFGMTPQDYAQLRLEAEEKQHHVMHAHERDHDPGAVQDRVDVHAELSYLPGVGGNVVEAGNATLLNGMLPPPRVVTSSSPPTPSPPSPEGSASAPQIEVRCGGEGEGEGGGAEAASNSTPPAAAGMSFADRFLQTRMDVDFARSFARAATPSAGGDASGNLSSAAASHSMASGPLRPGQLNAAAERPGGGGGNSFSSAASLTSRRQALYTHRAPLAESAAEPMDAFSLQVNSVEHDISDMLKQRKLEDDSQARQGERRASMAEPSRRPSAAAHALDGGGGVVGALAEDHGSHQPDFEPIAPSKSKSRVSKLILFPGQSSDTYIPLYKGPAFTFMEDELTMPMDTDFAALTTILSSCESLMSEFESLTGSTNSVNGYQKQLHESSIITAQLDKWSTRIKAYQQGIHDRYHYPPPPPQKRGRMNTQDDPFDDWKV